MTDLTHYLWVDLETTGLDPVMDPILEIGCVLTDIRLESNLRHFSTPVWVDDEELRVRLDLNPYVREMHTKNGLLSCLEGDDRWPQPREAEGTIIDMFLREGVEKNKVVLAGSGVAHFDRNVLRAQMPTLFEWFYYRPLDIGNIRSFVKYTMERPDLLPSEEESNHRALDDILRALAEARKLKERFSELDIQSLDEEG